jgi:hypothetical protein
VGRLREEKGEGSEFEGSISTTTSSSLKSIGRILDCNQYDFLMASFSSKDKELNKG